MTTLITIIVPVYNIEKYLSDCIESLVNQTYKNVEIILVDDGSKDGSVEICDRAALNDSRVKVLHKQNGGLSSARNAGLKAATGDYIMFVDGDDYLSLNAVEFLIDLIKENPVDLIQFDYLETEKEYSQNIDNDIFVPEIIANTKEMFEKLYAIGGAAASACTKFYKRELFKNLSFCEGIIHEDEYFTTRLLQNVKNVMYIGNKLYYYVMRQNSIVKSGFSPKRFDSLLVSSDRMETLEKSGYFDLLEKEKSRYFLTAITIWCNAFEVKDKASLKKAIEHIKLIISKPLCLYGKFRLIYRLCKVNVNLLFIYYLYKKITKQV